MAPPPPPPPPPASPPGAGAGGEKALAPSTRGGVASGAAGTHEKAEKGALAQLGHACRRMSRSFVKAKRREHKSAMLAENMKEVMVESNGVHRKAAAKTETAGGAVTAGRGATNRPTWQFGEPADTANKPMMAGVTMRGAEAKEKQRVAIRVTNMPRALPKVPEYTTWRTIKRNRLSLTDQRKTVLYKDPLSGEMLIASDDSSDDSDSSDGEDDQDEHRSLRLHSILPPGSTVTKAIGGVGRIVTHDSHKCRSRLAHAAAASELMLAREWESGDDYVLLSAARSFLPAHGTASQGAKRRRVDADGTVGTSVSDHDNALTYIREKLPLAKDGNSVLDRNVIEHRVLMHEIMVALQVIDPPDESATYAECAGDAAIDAGFDRYAFALSIQEGGSASGGEDAPVRRRNPNRVPRSPEMSKSGGKALGAGDVQAPAAANAAAAGGGMPSGAAAAGGGMPSGAMLRTLFCRRCMEYDCSVHGVGQKTVHTKPAAILREKRGAAPVAFTAPPKFNQCGPFCFYGSAPAPASVLLSQAQVSALARARASLSNGGSGMWWSSKATSTGLSAALSDEAGGGSQASGRCGTIAVCSLRRFMAAFLPPGEAPSCAAVGTHLRDPNRAETTRAKAVAAGGAISRRRGDAATARALSDDAGAPSSATHRHHGADAAGPDAGDDDAAPDEDDIFQTRRRRRGPVPTKQVADPKARRRVVAWMRQQQLNAGSTKSVPSEYKPCSCTAVCHPNTCECAAAGNFCDLFCGCPPTCALRFSGCKCRKSACGTRQCPCYAAGRECDPTLCKCCPWESSSLECLDLATPASKAAAPSSGNAQSWDKLPFWRPSAQDAKEDLNRALTAFPTDTRAKVATTLFDVAPEKARALVASTSNAANASPSDATAMETRCSNMNLLLSRRRRVRLGLSSVAGWGAFLIDGAQKGDYIGEYTGELVPHREADRRGKKYDRENLSFLFDLNDRWVLDARLKGNKLKFANHSATPNCRARVMLVRGDHRVGIYACEDIPPQTELFYDYRYDHDKAPTWAGGSGDGVSGRPKAGSGGDGGGGGGGIPPAP